jgi:hypothetical protein
MSISTFRSNIRWDLRSLHQRPGEEPCDGVLPVVLASGDPVVPVAGGTVDGFVTASVAVLPGSFVSAAGLGAALTGIPDPPAAYAGTPLAINAVAMTATPVIRLVIGYPFIP